MATARRAKRLLVPISAAALTVFAAIPAAEAGGFSLREQSAYGQGMSFAGIAAGGSLSSMFWNPATLAQVMGFEVEGVASGIFPTSDVTVEGPPVLPGPIFTGLPADQGDIAFDALAPAAYAAYRVNDRLVFGVGVNAPFGLVTKYPQDSILRALGVAGTSEVFTLNVNPAVSFQVTDWLAIAVGAQIQYADARYTALGLPAPLGSSSVSGDGFGYGFTAGLLLTPMEGTEIGLGYRSRIEHELDGTLTTAGLGDFDASADGFDLPDIVTFGIRQRITDSFRVMAGIEWTNWSTLETVTLSGAPVPIPLDFDYEDSWFFSLGGEYDVNERLTVRAGIGYETSPIDDSNRSFRLPDNNRVWLSAGASFRANDRLSFDLGYSYLFVEDTDIQAGTGFGGGGPDQNGPFFGESDAHVHIVTAGLKYRFGGPAKPAMADYGEPIVVKP